MTADAAQDAAAADVRCARCGAPAVWDPQARGLKCGSCQAVTPVEAPPPPAGHTLQDASRRWPERPRRPGSYRLGCPECGAVVDTIPGALTGACPFCGSGAVAEVADDGRSFPPDAVLPFTVSREVARAGYRTWLEGLWFRPRGLRRGAHLDSLTPVYVPFWAFDFQALTDWRVDYASYESQVGFNGGNTRRLGPWKGMTSQHEDDYVGVLAQGSTGLPEGLWRRLEPFPLDDARAYDGRFLAGHPAGAARVQPLEAWQGVRQATGKRARLECEARVPGDKSRRFEARTSYHEVAFRQVLLPVWVAAYRYRGRPFRFLVNGATGEVQGRAPWSYLKIATLVAVLLAVLGGAIWGAGVPLTRAAVAQHHRTWLRAHPHPPHVPTATERRKAIRAKAREEGLKPFMPPGAEPVHLPHFGSGQGRGGAAGP